MFVYDLVGDFFSNWFRRYEPNRYSLSFFCNRSQKVAPLSRCYLLEDLKTPFFLDFPFYKWWRFLNKLSAQFHFALHLIVRVFYRGGVCLKKSDFININLMRVNTSLKIKKKSQFSYFPVFHVFEGCHLPSCSLVGYEPLTFVENSAFTAKCS